MFVHYAVGSAVANRFAALGARGDKEGLRAFVRDAVHWTFWPSLAAAVTLLALGMPLLWLFGPKFVAGYPVMLILVVGFLFRSSMGPAEFLLKMLGEQSAVRGRSGDDGGAQRGAEPGACSALRPARRRDGDVRLLGDGRAAELSGGQPQARDRDRRVAQSAQALNRLQRPGAATSARRSPASRTI